MSRSTLIEETVAGELGADPYSWASRWRSMVTVSLAMSACWTTAGALDLLAVMMVVWAGDKLSSPEPFSARTTKVSLRSANSEQVSSLDERIRLGLLMEHSSVRRSSQSGLQLLFAGG